MHSIYKNSKSNINELGCYIDQVSTKLPKKKKPMSFTSQTVTLDDAPLPVPKGLEELFFIAYTVLLPYLTGLLFSFFYISKMDKKLFLSFFNDSPFILTWAVGYEVLAGVALLAIAKSAIGFKITMNSKK